MIWESTGYFVDQNTSIHFGQGAKYIWMLTSACRDHIEDVNTQYSSLKSFNQAKLESIQGETNRTLKSKTTDGNSTLLIGPSTYRL